jgi:hypothetical protein
MPLQSNADLLEKLREAEEKPKEQKFKEADAVAYGEEKMKNHSEDVKRLEEVSFEVHAVFILFFVPTTFPTPLRSNTIFSTKANAELIEKLKLSEEREKMQESKHLDAVASSKAQAEMMHELCDQLKQLEAVRCYHSLRGYLSCYYFHKLKCNSSLFWS